MLRYICLLILLAVAVSLECSNPATVLVARPEGQDYYLVTLAEYGDVISWYITDEDGNSLTGSNEPNTSYIVNPTDCSKTNYSVLIQLDCNGDAFLDTIIQTTVNIEPIPIEELSTFTRDDYDILRSNKVNSGDSVTMTCQTSDDAQQLYGDDFTPLYTWLKAREFGGSDVVQESSTSNIFVVESAKCENAGYYYCKIRRCPQHSEETPACNNNDLVIQQTVPQKTNSKCRIFGDPHVITFDGSIYNYKGQCWYVLAMDGVGYRWFVYGWFSPCGDKSTCLESVSIVARTEENPGGTQLQLLRGFGISLGGTKKFIRRGVTEQLNGISMTYTGRKLEVAIPEHEVTVLWDGLACVTILVNKDKPTLGICGDNDGSKDNDYSSFYDGKNRTSDEFVDAWSIGQGCTLSYDIPDTEIPQITSMAQLLQMGAGTRTMPTQFVRQFCKDTLQGYKHQAAPPQLSYVVDELEEDLVEEYIEACLTDIKLTEEQFYDIRYNFQGCIIASVLAEEAEDLGMCLDRWDVSAKCPGPQEWREEAIRIGCIWTAEDAAIVLS